MPRFLICHTHCDPKYINRQQCGISSELETEYAGLIKDLILTFRFSQDPIIIHPTQESIGVLDAHHDAIVDRRNSDLKDINIFAARWNEQAWRISVVLHAARYGKDSGNHDLDQSTANNAIELVDFFAAHQLQILEESRIEGRRLRFTKLLSLIDDNHGKITLRELERRNRFKPDEVTRLAEIYSDEISISVLKPLTGRPSRVVQRTTTIPG